MRHSDRRLAVVVGAAGQDGTLLSRYLLQSGCVVRGITRHSVISEDGSAAPLSLMDIAQVDAFIGSTVPDQIYYLAAHHHSSDEDSGGTPELLQQSYDVHCASFANLLDSCSRKSRHTKIFYASSALVFGHPLASPQTELSPMRPVCVYGMTKLLGMDLCELYRRDHGMFCSAGILFNHESHLRPEKFVTRKITRAVAEIKRGSRKTLTLAAPEIKVDWSAAEDFVRAMHVSLSADVAQDYVYASGNLHSIEDFCDVAFRAAGLNFRDYLEVDSSLMKRSSRSVPLHGDPSRLMASTGWAPKVSFEELISGMVQYDLDSAS